MKNHQKCMQTKQNTLCEDKLYAAFAMLKTADEARLFIQDLCTPAEIQALADRWKVVADIKNRKSYRQINTETHISVTTIGRVARCIMLGTGGYNLMYDRMTKMKK
jgi:TrpR-related protein YerC/YecD